MRVLLVLLALAGCHEGTVIDVDKTALEDYQDWKRVDAVGEVPGHGDTYRIIYANPDAEDRLEMNGFWSPATIIVKEIHDRDGDQPGDLRYIGIMRQMDESETPDGAELHRTLPKASYGWLFTYLEGDIESDEEYRESCWSECHVAAPYSGAFLDYSR
jgi:hypothetical protein